MRRWWSGWKRWVLAGVVSVSALGTSASAIAEAPELPQYTGCGGVNVPVVNGLFEQQVVELVNQERLNNGGLPPLKHVSALSEAARYHAADLAQDNYFSHDTYDGAGGTTFVCNTWQRIGTYYSGATGENIAAGYDTPAWVMDGWMNSPGHRANILSATHREIGMGYYNAAGSSHYWVQDFGWPVNSYPLIINREAITTTTRSVSIYLYGSFTHMRLKNDTDADYGPWQAFQNSFNWTLGPGNGLRTVTAQLSNDGGTSIAVTTSDSINLNGQPQLGSLPGDVTFLYSLATSQLYPASAQLLLEDPAVGTVMTWSASQTGSWFTLSSTSGSTPATLTITPTSFGSSPATFTGSVTVTVTSPSGVANSPQTVNVTMVVADQVAQLYLPLIQR
jgi:uncharacterized protein YkwD